jgi:hypothetical protein
MLVGAILHYVKVQNGILFSEMNSNLTMILTLSIWN